MKNPLQIGKWANIIAAIWFTLVGIGVAVELIKLTKALFIIVSFAAVSGYITNVNFINRLKK